jgi:hypothetical protein
MFFSIKSIFSSLGAVVALLQLLPSLRALVHEVEAPGVSGADKKQAVLTMLKETLGFATSTLKLTLPVDTVLNYAGGMIDVIVAIENAFGRLLPHAAAAAPAPAVSTDVASAPAVATTTDSGPTNF